MPLLQLLTSHHEVRVVLCVPSQVRGDNLYQFPIAPLLQQDRWPAVCDTGGKNGGGLAPKKNLRLGDQQPKTPP